MRESAPATAAADTGTTGLFSPLALRSLTARNRIGVSPMCQYSCASHDGLATTWHLVHLGSRAVGGAGIVSTEAAAVTAEGRISPDDLGIWSDAHAAALAPAAAFIREQGAIPAIQLAHAGRKASTRIPWASSRGQVPDSEGGWDTVGPSPVPFAPGERPPRELSEEDIRGIVHAFAAAAARSVAAGFQIVEIHAAHGYLFHEFLSPNSNYRTDGYGGTLEGRMRILRECVTAIRAVIPDELPLFVRMSCSEWIDGPSFTIDEAVLAAKVLSSDGVDLIDCSSGGNVPVAKIPSTPGYQVDFARRIRTETPCLTAAVGLITDARQAQEIVETGSADAVLLARAMLRDPYWPLHAARELGAELSYPVQYQRGDI